MVRSVKYLQVSTHLVRDKEITNNAFATYAYLKNVAFGFRESEFKINHNELKFALGISDNRTLKDAFANLHKHGWIVEPVNKFPVRSDITVKLNTDSKQFAQLPCGVLQCMQASGPIGLRLLFLYESYINRTEVHTKHFAFPSYDTIMAIMSVSTATLAKYNSLLEGIGFLTIRHNRLKTDNSYDASGRIQFSRYNNHYYPQIEKMAKSGEK